MLRQLFFLRKPAESGGTRYSYPTKDISNPGGWVASSGSDLYAMLDETSPSDTDYISITTKSGSMSAKECTLEMGAVTDPGVTTGHTISVRAKAENVFFPSLMVTLTTPDGTAAQFDCSDGELTSTFKTFTYTLTANEVNDYMGDYSSFKITLGSLHLTPCTYTVSWIRFEVPE